MRYIAPIPIILGVIGAIFSLFWLIAAGSEEDGGPSGITFLFGRIYILYRVTKQLFYDPMSVLPALGILLLSAGLIWLGVIMYQSATMA